jgi:glycosyltransferase 2 family protein
MQRTFRRLLPILALVAFTFCSWRVWTFVREYRLSEIINWLAAVPPQRIVYSVLFAAASYLTLTGYDYLAILYSGHRLSYRKVALASFVSVGLGYPLGPAPLGTGVLRYFYYSRLGLGLEDFTKVVFLIMATAMLGKFSFAGLVLLCDPSTTAGWSGLDETVVRILAAGALVGVAGYVLLSVMSCLEVRIGSWRFVFPSLGLALAQVALGTINYFCIAACLHQMMSASASISYLTVATSYVFANFAVLLTHVPGGWGVMDFVILSIVPGLDAIGALIAFRTIYYLIPLALALSLLLLLEGKRLLSAILSPYYRAQ